MSSELAAKLRELSERATPGPWAWDQRGEKVNEWGMGIAFDSNENQIAGRFTSEDVEYVEYVCSHEATTCNYADPRLITELRNNLPAILAALDGAEKVRSESPRSTMFRINALEDSLKTARDEIAVSDKLLDARNELLRAIPKCSQHGDQCIPHALYWVRSTVAREAQARADAIRECAALCRNVYGDEVEALGPDEPMAVGKKLAKACEALLPSEPSGERKP